VQTQNLRRALRSGGHGVYIRGASSSSIATASIENSRISDTSLDGVHLGDYSYMTLHYNDLFNIAGYTVNNLPPTTSMLPAATGARTPKPR